MMNKRLIYLKIALLINKELFEENRITYQVYKQVEVSILKELDNGSI